MLLAGGAFRRAPFLLGIGVGAVVTLLIGTALVFQGAVDASALYRSLGPEVRVWDRHGLENPARWELVTGQSHRFASVRDVYVETAEVRIFYGGTPDAPFSFVVEPKTDAMAPPDESGSPEFDPGPASLAFPNNQELSFALAVGGTRARVLTRATWRGYVLRMTGDRDGQRLRAARFTGPWMVHNEVGSVAAGAVGSFSQQLQLEPGRAYVLSVPDGNGLGLVAGSPQWLDITTDGAGFHHEAWVTPVQGNDNRVFVGAPDDALEGSPLSTEPPGVLTVAPTAAGRFLLTSVSGDRRRDRLLELGAGAQRVSVDPGTSLAGLRSLDGPGGPEGLRSQALSGFAAR